MAEDTDYEFIPRATLEDMKKQIAELQRQTQQKEKISTDQFSQAIMKLTQSMEEMNALFRAATEELKLEEETGHKIDEYIEPINERLNAIEDQNKKIADAMLALADMLEDLKKQGSMQIDALEELKRDVASMQVSPMPSMQKQSISMPLSPKISEEGISQELPPFGLEQPSMEAPGTESLPPPPLPSRKKHLFSFKK
ncbi:MAG: hypothetical protein QW331_01330 [Candidatus Woesearchaeota archaeon]